MRSTGSPRTSAAETARPPTARAPVLLAEPWAVWDDPGITVRYAYDTEGRLLERRAVVIDNHEGESFEEEAWAWSYRYDCSEPRPDDDDTY